MTDATEPTNSSTPSGISRRTMIKTAAWTLPAVAVATSAPAWAMSACTPTVSFDKLVPGTSPDTITFQPSGTTAALSYDSDLRVAAGWWDQGGNTGNTGEVASTSTSPAWNYLEVQLGGRVDEGDWIDVTISLSEPVTGLSFLIHDIDRSSTWDDEVVVSPAGFGYDRGTNIVGVGTSSSPFSADVSGDTPIDGGAGRVRVTWAGEVQSVTVRYRAGDDANADQHIGIGNISYDACLTQERSSKARSLSAPATGTTISATAPVPAPVESDAQVDS